MPDGFEALAVVDSLKGFARHLAVNSNGDIYVKTRFHARSDGYGNVALRDTDQDGKADIINGKAGIITHFSKYESGPFGTAMKIHNGYLYFSSNLMVYRQKLKPGQLVPDSKIDTIVIDNPPSHIHQGKSIAFDGKSYMYVGWGAGSDICSDGRPGSMGEEKPDAVIPGEGCPLLIGHGGIWKFDENKLNQVMENGKATGPWEVFADGFIQTDPVLTANAAGYRPMGIAEGPDGSLYISETEKGKIWRVMFKGDKAKFGPARLAKMAIRKKTASNIKDPDPVKDDLDRGKPIVASAVYTMYCGTCHQRDGKGDGARFPPLEGSEWVNGDKTRLISIVLNGLSGPITVKGIPYSEAMPAHGSFLNDDQVAEVLTYIRKNWDNNSDAVSREEVAAVRKAGSK